MLLEIARLTGMARTPKKPSKQDATIEVSDHELTDIGRPPLPTRDDTGAAYSWVGTHTASVMLALVQATLPVVKQLEARLVRVERRLHATTREARRSTDAASKPS